MSRYFSLRMSVGRDCTKTSAFSKKCVRSVGSTKLADASVNFLKY